MFQFATYLPQMDSLLPKLCGHISDSVPALKEEGLAINTKNTLIGFYFKGTPVSMQWCLMMVHIIQLTKNGIILSWAVEGQGGRFHVNELNNTAIVQVRIGTACYCQN
jgi:hypothetical protein